MQKLIPIIILLLSLSEISLGQLQIDWQQCYGGSENDKAYEIVSANNGYMIIGSTDSNDGDISYTHGEKDGWLIRIDEAGNLLWEKCYGGSGSDGAHRIFQADESTDYFIVAGSNSSNGDISNDPYPGSLDYWIIKIDSAGTILWDKIVGGNGLDQIWTGTATSDGGIIGLGWSGSVDGDITNPYGTYDMWLIKLNGNGDIEWDFSIGSQGFDYGQAILQTSDGGFLVGGTSRPEGEGNINCEPFSSYGEAILFKLDANGNELWQQCYGGSDHEGITGILELQDGYIFSAFGNSDDGDMLGSGYHGGGESDIWLVKIDFDGNIIWQKCYGGTNTEAAKNLFQTSNGDIMVFGNTYSFNGDVVGNHSLNSYRPTIWVFKINSTGDMQWQQCIGGIAEESIEFGVIQKSDLNYIVAGRAILSPSFDVDCTGYPTIGNKSNYWAFGLSDTMVSIVEHKPTFGVKVYPNPAKDYVLFEFNPDNQQYSDVVIKNIFGQIIQIKNLKQFLASANNKWMWDTRNIEPGIYFYTLKALEFSESGKIIICK